MTPKPHSYSTATGYLFALGATAIWSGNFIVARGLSNDIPPVSLAFFRWMTAVLVCPLCHQRVHPGMACYPGSSGVF